MRQTLRIVLAGVLATSLSGCFLVSSRDHRSSSSQPVASEPHHKNRGQARKEEVHERNAARKAAKDREKAKKKADKEEAKNERKADKDKK